MPNGQKIFKSPSPPKMSNMGGLVPSFHGHLLGQLSSHGNHILFEMPEMDAFEEVGKDQLPI